MPPEFENSFSKDKVLEEEEEKVDANSDDEETTDDLTSALAKIKISPSTTSGYSPADNIPAKFLNPLGFVNYNHLGQFPWGPEDNIAICPEFTQVTDVLGLDCEMVGVGPLQDSELGRVSVVNEYGFCIFDTFAKPEQEVTGYRSGKSGIYPENLENAPSVTKVVQQIQNLVAGKVLVGHSIHNDLEVLRIKDHPETRDTAVFFKNKLGRFGTPSLKVLTKRCLSYEIQTGDHSSIQDAQATLKLFLNHREEWEKELEETRQDANLPFFNLMSSPKPIKDINIEPRENDLNVESGSIFVRENKIIGAYGSSGEYLDVQFRLLLEDFLRPLRFGVKTIRTKGHQRVQISRLFRGAHMVLRNGETEMEVKKYGSILIPMVRNNLVDVDWDESKLFMNGSLLLVSPDNFKSVKFAIIKNGPRNSSNSNSSFTNVKVDVLFCKDGPSWVIDSTTNNFKIIESPAFFEAYRHTLSYLQEMPLDTFPMKPYIVDAVTTPSLPKVMCTYGTTKKYDFRVFVGNSHPKRFANPLDFETWPSLQDVGFDHSQYEAFKNSLTQKLSIIQGPPGTGKTFIGVETIKFLLTNPWLVQKSPILVVAYTNHALDQTLAKVFKFMVDNLCDGNVAKAEHLILRVGGGSKSDAIQSLVLKFKREKFDEKRKLKRTIEWQSCLVHQLGASEILTLTPGLLNFQNLPPISLSHFIEAAGEVWNKWKLVQNAIQADPVAWFGLQDLGLPSLSTLKKPSMANYNGKKKKNRPSLFYFEYPNLLKKIVEKHPNYITTNGAGQLDNHLPDFILSKKTNGVGEAEYVGRWSFYFYLLRRIKVAVDKIKTDLTWNQKNYDALKDYPSVAASKKLALVLGMTTTGAVKYKQDIVSKLKPKIMFVEEAAHVLEAHVVASLTEHCEQLIMIGDHQQLRPMTADHDMSSKYRLDVSLMERLVRNGIDQKQQNWIQLKNQHRMRPEIARMVCPVIYLELYNDASVEKYPNVKGSQKNIYFVDHHHPEAREKGSASFHNKAEIDFVATLVKYFVLIMGYKPSQITVIATYLAQKIQIEQKLNNIMLSARQDRVLVSTVDGYQGEENDIVILSLVRSNDDNNIGFLKTDNRVCVALSRARHGFFMIGNMSCLKASSDTWDTINNTLIEMGCIGDKIPLGNSIDPKKFYRCTHSNATSAPCNQNVFSECSHKTAVKCHTVNNRLERPICSQNCSHIFDCGHQCRFRCHEFDYASKHQTYKCLEKCNRVCPVAGHPCTHGHHCFQNCFVYEGVGCQVQMSINYACGHRTMVSCHRFSTQMTQNHTRCLKCVRKNGIRNTAGQRNGRTN